MYKKTLDADTTNVENLKNNKQLPCGKASCMFADCIKLDDGKNDIIYDVAPCEVLGQCPNRLGINS